MEQEKEEFFSLEQIGKYGVPSLVLQGKRKLPFSWNVDRKFHDSFKSNGSIKTNGLIFNERVINSTKWCFCTLHCGLKWNYEWLIYLRMILSE
jgi:hypothetical protein